MKKFALVAATALFFIVLALLLASRPGESRRDRIMRGCQREFGEEGEERVNQCAIEIMIRELREREAAKMERAAR